MYIFSFFSKSSYTQIFQVTFVNFTANNLPHLSSLFFFCCSCLSIQNRITLLRSLRFFSDFIRSLCVVFVCFLILLSGGNSSIFAPSGGELRFYFTPKKFPVSVAHFCWLEFKWNLFFTQWWRDKIEKIGTWFKVDGMKKFFKNSEILQEYLFSYLMV